MRYNITGEPMPVVICDMEVNESMITEKGSMVWMSPNMEMQTSAGGIGKAFGRMFSGESMFQNIYTARGGPGMIAFASSFPGSIRASSAAKASFYRSSPATAPRFWRLTAPPWNTPSSRGSRSSSTPATWL